MTCTLICVVCNKWVSSFSTMKLGFCWTGKEMNCVNSFLSSISKRQKTKTSFTPPSYWALWLTYRYGLDFYIFETTTEEKFTYRLTKHDSLYSNMPGFFKNIREHVTVHKINLSAWSVIIPDSDLILLQFEDGSDFFTCESPLHILTTFSLGLTKFMHVSPKTHRIQ